MVVVLEVQGLGALKVPVQDLETKEVLLFSLWDPVSPVVPGLDVFYLLSHLLPVVVVVVLLRGGVRVRHDGHAKVVAKRPEAKSCVA